MVTLPFELDGYGDETLKLEEVESFVLHFDFTIWRSPCDTQKRLEGQMERSS